MSDHVDVLIVGAGLSGISAACHLQTKCPDKTYAILEARAGMGGTWDLFTYPGIRSDSDMFTLGFSFRPWPEAKAIADGPAILKYIRETADEYGVDEHIRYEHRVVRASWSSQDARWTVEAERGPGRERVTITCDFFFTCTGYYRYDEGYTPELPGIERFGGQVVHPQKWSDDVDYAGKRVVVIGSGATAVTLVPAMAPDAEHVTMLQRTPSYVVPLPNRDPISVFLRGKLPPEKAHPIVRWKNVLLTMLSYQLARRRPNFMRRVYRWAAMKFLPQDYEVDTHFNPPYDPWDQRVCLVPDGDLFRSISKGEASVVTDRIATFTETGIELESGKTLEADLIITATGLQMQLLGGMEVEVDGELVDPPSRLSYKGLSVSGVPNFALAIGYTNASWTLKCELICEYVCRLLNYMDEHGYRVAVPTVGEEVVETRPLLELTSGYVQRSIAKFPKQGVSAPWRVYQNYLRDVRMLRYGPVDDGVVFSRTPAARPAPSSEPTEKLAA